MGFFVVSNPLITLGGRKFKSYCISHGSKMLTNFLHFSHGGGGAGEILISCKGYEGGVSRGPIFSHVIIECSLSFPDLLTRLTRD